MNLFVDLSFYSEFQQDQFRDKFKRYATKAKKKGGYKRRNQAEETEGGLSDKVLNAVKCNLTEVTTKGTCIPLEVSGVNTYANMSQSHVLVDLSIAWRTYREDSLVFCCVAAHRPGSSLPTPLPSLFPLFQQCDGCLFLLLRAAHGWVATVCQPWEQSSSRSWLPLVEAPGCFRHPTSILAMHSC